ncbi:VCBS repeat-containing protein [Candidatus Poribacteria bacterium]|nr:VCBS repeat-containing protein [Candidatus Poribacteria bacterium]MYK18678.1 VCBS repeat-containing protein [Candidatus Poribacteria bacterium]
MKFKGYLLDDTVRSVYGLAVADINGDGQLDIIAGSTGEPIIAWYEAPDWKRHLVTNQGSGHITIAPYDLTGNGTPDLIVGSGFNRGVNAAEGYLQWLEVPAEDGQNWKSHRIADIPFIHRVALANLSGNTSAASPFLIVASIRGEDGKPGE